MDFKILTDTSCNLPGELVASCDLSMVPLRYVIDSVEHESYAYGEQVDFHDFYEQLRQGHPATTSQADPHEAEQIARPILESGQDLLYIGFSSGLSGTYESVSSTLDRIAADYPDRTVLSVDSLAASTGQGLLLTYASDLRAQGMGIREVHDWVERHRLNICHWFTVTDLMFLKRGGRVSAVSAIFGSALSIKPVMHVDEEGKLRVTSKVRGRKKSIEALVGKFAASLTRPMPQSLTRRAYISHGDCLEEAQTLADMIAQSCDKAGVQMAYPTLAQIDPVIGAHSGPGTLALFFYDDPSNR